MKIGVPKEVKNNEFRVGLTPESVAKLIDFNHEVFIQTNAGAEIGFFDSDYAIAGAIIVNSAEELYAQSELIVKVKEPVPEEFKYLRDDRTVGDQREIGRPWPALNTQRRCVFTALAVVLW